MFPDIISFIMELKNFNICQTCIENYKRTSGQLIVIWAEEKPLRSCVAVFFGHSGKSEVRAKPYLSHS